MNIPITDLIGDVVTASVKDGNGILFIYFASGRWLRMLDLPGEHAVEAYDPR